MLRQDVIEMAIENLVLWNPKFDGEKVFRKGKKNYELKAAIYLYTALFNLRKGQKRTDTRWLLD